MARNEITDTFKELAGQWRADTKLLGTVRQKARHPAYQQIIGMGVPALPLILEDLQEHPLTDWFWALNAITGANPITAAIAGDMEAMAAAWITWGKKAGYLNDSSPKTKPSSPTSETMVTS